MENKHFRLALFVMGSYTEHSAELKYPVLPSQLRVFLRRARTARVPFALEVVAARFEVAMLTTMCGPNSVDGLLLWQFVVRRAFCRLEFSEEKKILHSNHTIQPLLRSQICF